MENELQRKVGASSIRCHHFGPTIFRCDARSNLAGFLGGSSTYREFMGLGFFATGYGLNRPRRDFRWGHGGSAAGICTDVRTYPATYETIIVLSNRSPPDCYPVANFLHQQYDLRGHHFAAPNTLSP